MPVFDLASAGVHYGRASAGVSALRDVSFTVQPGERIVVPATSGDMPMSFFVERL